MSDSAAITVVPLETPTLGDRSYLVHDGEVAFVVDPQRDIDRVLALLDDRQLRLTHVFESHIHNDYVTGGFALAQRTGAAYMVNAEDHVSFERTPVRDGEVIRVGPRIRVSAVATPGHTFTHLSYVLTDTGASEQMAVFSGGSLLFGATSDGARRATRRRIQRRLDRRRGEHSASRTAEALGRRPRRGGMGALRRRLPRLNRRLVRLSHWTPGRRNRRCLRQCPESGLRGHCPR